MTLIIEIGDPRDPQIVALLQASHALMDRLFQSEDNHYLSIDDLCASDIHFYIAREGVTTLGCGALADKAKYGEIKFMFVHEDARGKGVANALMRQIEDQARECNLPELKLETGDLLHAALRLYARHGYSKCAPFGDYTTSASSVFMGKQL